MARLCTIDDCGRPHLSRGLCSGHYRRLRLTGSVGTTPLRAQHVPAIERVRARLVPEGDCLVFDGARTPQGYGSIRVGEAAVGTHVVVAEAEHGPRPSPKHEVLHSCDNRPCCNPEHLRWGTQKDNVRDAMERGRWSPPTGRWGRHAKTEPTKEPIA